MRRYTEVIITREGAVCREKVVVRAKVGNGNGEDGRGGATGKRRTGPVWSLSLLQTNYFGNPTSKRSGAPFIGRRGGYLGTLVPLALCTGGQFFFFWPLGKAGDEQAESRSNRGGGGPESPAGRVQGWLLGRDRKGGPPGTRHPRCNLTRRPSRVLRRALHQAAGGRIAQSRRVLSSPHLSSAALRASPAAALCCSSRQTRTPSRAGHQRPAQTLVCRRCKTKNDARPNFE